MSKNLRLPLFGFLALAVLGLLAFAFFAGSDEEQAEQKPSIIAKKGTTKHHKEIVSPLHFSSFTPRTEVETKKERHEEADLRLEQEAKSSSTTKAHSEPKDDADTGPLRPALITYTIKPGDMISKIAQNFECKRSDIYAANPGLNDQTALKIRPGQKIIIPNKNSQETLEQSKSTEVVVHDQPQHQPTKETPSAESSETREHKLKKDDMIFALAKEYYGSPVHWRLIRDANPDCDFIKPVPGKTVIIPALPSQEDSSSSSTTSRTHHESVESSSLIPPMRR